MMKICIPLAIQIVIDDVGWWYGENSSGTGGPYRSGISRYHVPDDYRAIVELGKRLDMCPQAAMVLCEWDRDNILRNVPTSTWMGERWDNTRWVGEWLEEAADIIISNTDHMELTLHGVGHEYWDDLGMSRCEWYGSDGKMRPFDQVILHLEYFDKLLQKNHLGKFPESFVPPGFNYRFSPHADELASILLKYGIKYNSTMFSTLFKDEEPEGRYFGTEHGILTVDRSWATIDHNVFEPELSGEITGPVCGIHWPNVLHLDPEINLETVEAWVQFLEVQDMRFDSMLARNTAESFSQVVYNWGAALSFIEHNIIIDFRKIDKINSKGLLNYFYIKTCGSINLKSASPHINVTRIHRKFTEPYKIWKIHRRESLSFGVVEFDECNIMLPNCCPNM